MILTAQEAYNLAKDKNAINKFIEKMDLSIEAAANSGKFATQEYISWSVTETAVQQIAGIYRDRGFTVVYEDRSKEKESYISFDNYSERLVKISWKDVKNYSQKQSQSGCLERKEQRNEILQHEEN